MHDVLRACSQQISAWGSAACRSSHMAVTSWWPERAALHGRSSAPREGREQVQPLPRCLPGASRCFRGCATMFRAPALLPLAEGAEVCCIRWTPPAGLCSLALRDKDAEPSLPPPWPPTPRCATGRAGQGIRQWLLLVCWITFF